MNKDRRDALRQHPTNVSWDFVALHRTELLALLDYVDGLESTGKELVRLADAYAPPNMMLDGWRKFREALAKGKEKGE